MNCIFYKMFSRQNLSDNDIQRVLMKILGIVLENEPDEYSGIEFPEETVGSTKKKIAKIVKVLFINV